MERVAGKEATGTGKEAEEGVAVDESIESRKRAGSRDSDGLDSGAGKLFAELLPPLAVEKGKNGGGGRKTTVALMVGVQEKEGCLAQRSFVEQQ